MSEGLEALKEMRDEAVSSICRYIPRQAHKEVTGYFDKRKSIIEEELKEHEQYKAIEEELGIDLVTLFKVFKDGIYVKLNGEIDHVQYVSIFKKRKWHLYSSSTFWGKYDIGLVKDYGKTCALTREELEK